MDSSDIVNPAIFEELLKSSRKATKEDIQLSEDLQALMAHKGWSQYLNQVLGTRIQALGSLLLEPSGSSDGMVRSEFLKGALYGLCLARDMPSVIVASMRDVRQPQENTDAT
jgi:hypothetical protein